MFPVSALRPYLFAITAAAALFTGCPFLGADTVVLKSGEQIEGKVVLSNDKEVVIETRFGESITNQERYPRADVARVIVKTKDIEAFSELEKAPLPVNALSPADFEDFFAARRKFLSDFGYSSKTGEARAQIAQGEKESGRVQAGEVKIEGRWLKLEEIQQESYQIGALRQLVAMQRARNAGNLVAALNAFAVLEKEYPNSMVFPEAVVEARQNAVQLDKVLQHELRNFTIKEATRERQIAIETPDNQARIRAARAAEIERLKVAAEQATARGEKFPPYSNIDEEGMKKLQALLMQESARLGGMVLTPLQESVAATRQAVRLLDEREFQAAKTALEKALGDWKENELATRLLVRAEQEIAARANASDTQRQAAEKAAEGAGFEQTTAPGATE